MRLPKPVEGVFPNTMAYVRWGDGPKTLLVGPGGPGNAAPTKRNIRMIGRSLGPLVENGYTLWMVTRRRGMPQGHTIEDMASDYADLIDTQFDGKVNLYVGLSYGGLIGQCLAANHPDRFDHIALVGAAHAVSEQVRRLEYDYATALSQGDRGKAGRLMVGAILTDSWLQWTAPVLGSLMGRIFPPGHDQFASDVIVETDATMAFNARSALPRIKGPLLLIGGDKDYSAPVALFEETARLIPDCTLRIYEGKGHIGVFRSRRLAPDILDFINKNPAVAA